MASTDVFVFTKLTEDDVPGAKIPNNNFDGRTNMELKRWLTCRGLKTTGNRPDLLKRCQDCLAAGTSKDIAITVDDGKWFEIKVIKERDRHPATTNHPPVLPITGWKPFQSCAIPSLFNYGHIYHYIMESVKFIHGNDSSGSDDDVSSTTAKPMRRGQQFIDSEHVINLSDTKSSECYFVRAEVLPSMKTDAPKHVHATISSKSGSVLDAGCDCKASALGRCSHVSGMLLYIDKHVKEHGNDNIQSCTSQPCVWNLGSKRAKNPQDVNLAKYKSKKKVSQKDVVLFDPRPPSARGVTATQINKFMQDLQGANQNTNSTSMWETVLTFKYEDYEVTDERRSILRKDIAILRTNLGQECDTFNTCFVHDNVYLVPGTEEQSASDTWTAHRWLRVTASVAKDAFSLSDVIEHPTSLNLSRCHNFIRANVWGMNKFTSAHMTYGIDNEDAARKEYADVKKLACDNFSVTATGLWINRKWPELGCSPDGLVEDPSSIEKYGLIEIKCLQCFKHVAPGSIEQGLVDGVISKKQISQSCFKLDENNKPTLKQNHAYYFQVQFQMLIMECNWCDFVLWSPKGPPSIERIVRDQALIAKIMNRSVNFWSHVIAPECFEMRIPRNLSPMILTC